MVNNHPPEKIRFKVGDIYNNAIGQYKILFLSDSTMQVEYSDGTISTLTISVQQRIVSRAMREADIRMLAEAKEKNRKNGLLQCEKLIWNKVGSQRTTENSNT